MLSRPVARSIDALAKDARTRRARLIASRTDREELTAFAIAIAVSALAIVALVLVFTSGPS